MKTTSKRILFILLSIGFLVAAVIVYSSFIRDAYASANALRSELESKKIELDNYKTTTTKVKSLFNELKSSGDVQNKVSLILPKEKDPAYLVSQISGLARLNNLILESISTNITTISPSKSAIVKNIGKLKADVNISGSYAGLKSFLNQIANNVLILDVTDVKVEGSSKSEQSALSYVVSITSYYQTE